MTVSNHIFTKTLRSDTPYLSLSYKASVKEFISQF